MIITIKAISRKPKETQYGIKTSVGIKSSEYGDRWLNGWADEINQNWKNGDQVEVSIEENNGYLNFKAIKPSVQPQQIAPQAPQSGYNQRPAQRPQHTENGFGKCKFGFLIELFKLGKNLNEAEAIAEAWAEASMRKLPQQTKPAQVAHQDYEQPDFPEEDQDVQIQNIPF